MSLARQTRDHVLSLLSASAPDLGGGLTLAQLQPARLQPEESPYTSAIVVAAGQIAMRLQHDLRRLKEIKSIELKIGAKRQMLPEYAAWIDGQLTAGREAGRVAPTGTVADEVLPTAMVWSIDIGDWPLALELARHVLRFGVSLPTRYERDAATLVLEEVAEAALKAQNRGDSFPLDVLSEVQELTAGIDMHDQPRAKLAKAIGTELARHASTLEPDSPAFVAAASLALGTLQRAQGLNERIGVKTEMKRLEKALAAIQPAQSPEPDPDEVAAAAPAADPAPDQAAAPDAADTNQAGDTPAA